MRAHRYVAGGVPVGGARNNRRLERERYARRLAAATVWRDARDGAGYYLLDPPGPLRLPEPAPDRSWLNVGPVYRTTSRVSGWAVAGGILAGLLVAALFVLMYVIA